MVRKMRRGEKEETNETGLCVSSDVGAKLDSLEAGPARCESQELLSTRNQRTITRALTHEGSNRGNIEGK
jgi:hypothetical protein